MTPEQQHEAFERPPKGTRKARGENNFTIFFTTVWKTYVFQPIKTLWTELSCRWCSPPTSQRHLWPSTTWSTSSTQVYARNAAMMQAISRAAAFEPRSRSTEPHCLWNFNGFQWFPSVQWLHWTFSSSKLVEHPRFSQGFRVDSSPQTLKACQVQASPAWMQKW